jgi:formate/nitrite transporter FocA (FNT family)
MSWVDNLVGCIVLAAVFVWGSGGAMLHSKSPFLVTVAAAKMNAPVLSLVARSAVQLARLPHDLDVGAHH